MIWISMDIDGKKHRRKKAARQVWRPLPAVFVLGAGIQRDTAGNEWILEMDLAINVPSMTDFND